MTSSNPPHSILLATDLSHRCDRALDRAVQLAQQWSARLLVVHAVEKEVDESYSLHSIYDVPSWRRPADPEGTRSEEHTSELQSLMRISYAVFCLNKKKHNQLTKPPTLKAKHT